MSTDVSIHNEIDAEAFVTFTVAGNDIYLLASNGKLYEFQEGADGENVPYSIRDTGLGKQCEFESMVYEADSDWLVMPFELTPV